MVSFSSIIYGYANFVKQSKRDLIFFKGLKNCDLKRNKHILSIYEEF